MDVVDASFTQLRAAILDAQDFSAADAAHRQYVDSLVSQVWVRVQGKLVDAQRTHFVSFGVERCRSPPCSDACQLMSMS